MEMRAVARGGAFLRLGADPRTGPGSASEQTWLAAFQWMTERGDAAPEMQSLVLEPSRPCMPSQFLLKHRAKGCLNLGRRSLDVLLRLGYAPGIELLQGGQSRLGSRWRIPAHAFEFRLQSSPDHCVNTACGTPGSDGVGAGVVRRRVPGPQAYGGQRASLSTCQRLLCVVRGRVFDFRPQTWHRASTRRQHQGEAPVLRCPGELERELRSVGLPAADTTQNTGVPHERAPAEACNLHS